MASSAPSPRRQATRWGCSTARTPNDLMYPRVDVAQRSFQDRESVVASPRYCDGQTQNSHRRLLELVGAWTGGLKPTEVAPAALAPPAMGCSHGEGAARQRGPSRAPWRPSWRFLPCVLAGDAAGDYKPPAPEREVADHAEEGDSPGLQARHHHLRLREQGGDLTPRAGRSTSTSAPLATRSTPASRSSWTPAAASSASRRSTAQEADHSGRFLDRQPSRALGRAPSEGRLTCSTICC
jgi:hypothetical protein